MVLAAVQAIEEPPSGLAGDVVLHASVVTLVRLYCAGLALWSRPWVYASTSTTGVPCSPACSCALNVVTMVLIRPRVEASVRSANGVCDTSGRFTTTTYLAPLASTWDLTRPASSAPARPMPVTAAVAAAFTAAGPPAPTAPCTSGPQPATITAPTAAAPPPAALATPLRFMKTSLPPPMTVT